MSQAYHAPPRASFLQKLGPGGVASLGLALLTVLGGAGLPWLFRCWQVLHGTRGDEPVHADAILVLGRRLEGDRLTPVFEARLAHAEALWRRGLAPHIVLAGGCAVLPGLDELVTKRAGVATVIANPFAAMQASDRVRPRQLAQDAPMLLIATGLALRSFE